MQEIADMLGVSKPTLFRYLKANSIQETFKKQNANMYDETAVNIIIDGFTRDKKDTHFNKLRNDEMGNNEIINSLKEQIDLLKRHDEEQKEQIKKLHDLLDQQQKLLLYEQQKSNKLIEENTTKKRWWQWWKI